MSRYARQKGHQFERDIARDFREVLGFRDVMTKREARGGDWSHTDDGTDLVGTDPFVVQCKRLIGYAPITAIEEISSGLWQLPCGEIAELPLDCIGKIPLLITKANGKPTMAVLPWADLQKLIRAAYPPKP